MRGSQINPVVQVSTNVKYRYAMLGPGVQIYMTTQPPKLCISLYGIRSRKKRLALLSRPMRWLSST